MLARLLCWAALLALVPAQTTTTLLLRTATWRYNDGATVPATNWFAAAFVDSSWKQGPAPLGYANQRIATTIGCVRERTVRACVSGRQCVPSLLSR